MIVDIDYKRAGMTLHNAARTEDESAAKSGTTLEVRLSLLITALLAIVTLAGGVYVVRKARDDIRVETHSTLVLTDHFLDAEIDVLHERWALHGFEAPLFKLRELGEIRHLSVKFYDTGGRLIESNDEPGSRTSVAPRWFDRLIRCVSPPLRSETRIVRFNDVPVGRLVIAADPSFETDEMWSTSRGLLALLLAFFLLVNTLVWWAASRAMRPVERILMALGDLRRGNLTTRLPSFDLPELSRISLGFNHMAATLEQSVTENQRLTRRLLETQETERTNLARELHDEIGQCVSAIHADAAAIRNRGGESVRESAEAIVEVTSHIKQIVRSMLQRLRPPVLEGLGLGPALRELVGAFQHRNPQVMCSLKTGGDLLAVDGEVGVAVYRVIQECLTNIGVHANARHATVDVQTDEAGHAGVVATAPKNLRCTVADDGIGFFLSSINRGFGLTGIRERVKVLGGTCEIGAEPGRGTRIVVVVPVSAAPAPLPSASPPVSI
jgi:two-component system sensor histidine kinase UhpB